MLKNDFIKMLNEDMVTNTNQNLKELNQIIIEVLSNYPNDLDIDSSKNVSNCYKSMFEIAKKKAFNNRYAMGKEETIQVIKNYFELPEIEKKADFINFDDFI